MNHRAKRNFLVYSYKTQAFYMRNQEISIATYCYLVAPLAGEAHIEKGA